MLSSWGTPKWDSDNWFLFLFFDTGKYTENLENVNNEQIILQNAIYKSKAAPSQFLLIPFDSNSLEKNM